MVLIDFIYYSILSIVPKKAIFGRRQVACTLFSSYLGFLSLSLYFWFSLIFNFLNNKYIFILFGIIILGGFFIVFRNVFLNQKEIRKLEHKYSKTSKILFKFIGISFLLFCFFTFIFSGITVSIIKQNKEEKLKSQIEIYQDSGSYIKQ